MYNQRARRYNERLYRRARFALEDFYGASMTPCYTQKKRPEKLFNPSCFFLFDYK